MIWVSGDSSSRTLERLYHSHFNVTHRLTPDYPLPRKLMTVGQLPLLFLACFYS